MFDIHHNVYITSPIDTVFNTIATGEGLEKWWTNRSTGDPILECVYSLYFAPQYDWRAKISLLNHNQNIEWLVTEADDDWMNTRFGFNLIQREQLIVAEFYHTGWKELNEHFKRSSYCWAMYLQLLKTYLETGKVTPFEQRKFV